MPKTTIIEKPELKKPVQNAVKPESKKVVEIKIVKPPVKVQEKPKVTKKPTNVTVSNGSLVKKDSSNGTTKSNGAKQTKQPAPISVKVVEQQDVVVKESFVVNENAVTTQRKKVARISHATHANPVNQVSENGNKPVVANDNREPQKPEEENSVVTESTPKVNSIRSMWEKKKNSKFSGFDANRDAAFDGEAKGRLKGAKALFENLATPKLQRRATTRDTSRTLPRSFNAQKPKRRPMSSVFDVALFASQQNLANQETVSTQNLSAENKKESTTAVAELKEVYKNGSAKNVETEKQVKVQPPVAKPRNAEEIKKVPEQAQNVVVNEGSNITDIKVKLDNPTSLLSEPKTAEKTETVSAKKSNPPKSSKTNKKAGLLKKRSKNKKSISMDDDYDGNFSDESGLSDVSSLSSGSDDDILSD